MAHLAGARRDRADCGAPVVSVERTPGYVAHAKAKATEVTVILVDGVQLDISEYEARWCLLCEDHDEHVAFATQTEARASLSCPEEWCPECRQEVAV